MVYILGKSTKGKGSAFKGIVPVVLVSGLSFLIPEMVVSYFVGAELAGVAASVISLVCTILASMKFTNPDAIPDEYRLEVKKGSPLKVGKTINVFMRLMNVIALL